MQYMILLYSDHNAAPDFEPGTPEFDQMMGEWMSFTKGLIDDGTYVAGEALTPPETATVVHRKMDGSTTLTDGPFADTKEQIGGYYIVDVPDLDAAIAIAGRVPSEGSFEVRPIAPTPDAADYQG